MRIGVDLGGTKIEAIALDDRGVELARHRVATPRFDYRGSIEAIVDLVARLERETGQRGTVGVGMPGALSPQTGLVKNANSTWLIDTAFDRDLAEALGRTVPCVNDANCLAVSEAVDGAAGHCNCSIKTPATFRSLKLYPTNRTGCMARRTETKLLTSFGWRIISR